MDRCIISNMCGSNSEFQLINPTTQTELTSLCIGNCNNLTVNALITWYVYCGSINLTTDIVLWTPLDNMTLYTNVWFFGE